MNPYRNFNARTWDQGRKTLKLGQDVQLTKKGIKAGLAPYGRKGQCLGVVTGFGPSTLSVQVLRVGLKTPLVYHHEFWEKA